MEEIYMYGSGECDQLGDIFKKKYDEEGKEILPPAESKFPRKLNISINLPTKINKICCGGMFNLALSNYGEVFSWGCADDSSLGREGPDNIPLKINIPIFVLDITAGDCHGVAYNNISNQIYVWGSFRNKNGKILEFSNPILLENNKLCDYRIKKIKSGSNHILFLTINKRVLCVGNGEFGQIGRDPNFQTIGDSEFIPNLLIEENIEDIFTGYNHSFMLQNIDNRNILKSWGNNRCGQLGIGEKDNKCNIPKIVSFPSLYDTEIIQCTGGEEHSIALTKNHQVYVWGSNINNQCGIKDKEKIFTSPILLEFFNQNDVMEIRSGLYYSYAFNPENGKVFSWGMGENCVLGNKSDDDKETPGLIPSEFFKNLSITDISLGAHHCAVLLRESKMKYEKEKKFEYDDQNYLNYNNNNNLFKQEYQNDNYNINDMRRRDDNEEIENKNFPFKYLKTEIIREENYNSINFNLYSNKMDIEYEINNVPSQNNYIGFIPINDKNNYEKNGFTYDQNKYLNYNNTSSEKKNQRNNLNNNVNIVITSEKKPKKKINIKISSTINKKTNEKKLKKINNSKQKNLDNSSSKKKNKDKKKEEESTNNFHLTLRSGVKKNKSPSKKKISSPSKSKSKSKSSKNNEIVTIKEEEEPKFSIKVKKLFEDNHQIKSEKNNLHVIHLKENKSKKEIKTTKNQSKKKNENNNKALIKKRENKSKKKSRTFSKPNKRKKLSVNLKTKNEVPILRRSMRLKEKKERKKFNEFI
jgi:regulator of chromosome condensation